MAKSTVLVSAALRRAVQRRLAALPPVTVEDLNAAALEREAKERRAREPVSIEGIHDGSCGGKVTYRSWYRDTAPRSELVGGGHTPRYTEFTDCSCELCGSTISHPAHLARFAELVAAHRSREKD